MVDRITSQEVSKIRQEFPILNQKIHDDQRLIYFDSAASSQTPQRVVDQLVRFYQADHANIHRGIHCLAERATQAYEQVRRQVAGFIKAKQVEEIIFTSGTTAGLNFLARGLVEPLLQSGDVILTTPLEHHSNLVPWQEVAHRTGATLRYCALDADYRVDLARTESQGAKCIVIQHVSNVLGTAQKLKDIVAWAHERDLLVIVDGAQAVAHLPLDMSDLGVDAYCFSGHKMFGPTGVGVCYLKQSHHDRCQPVQFGGEMIHRVGLYHSDYKQSPWKFEAGTPPIAQAIALGKGIDFIEEIGLDRMEAYVESLSQYLLEGLRAIDGVVIYGPGLGLGRGGGLIEGQGVEKEASLTAENPQGLQGETSEVGDLSIGGHHGIISFNIEGIHPHDASTAYDLQGIALRAGHHCAQPLMDLLGCQACLRASLMVYNTFEEVDRFLEATQAIKEFFLQ